MEDREVRGDMNEVYKLLTGKRKLITYSSWTPQRHRVASEDTRRNWQRTDQDWIQKNFSSVRVINGRNSLAVNSFKNAYDRYYCKYYGQHKVISCRVHQPTKLQSWSKDKTKATTHLTHCCHSFTLPVPVSFTFPARMSQSNAQKSHLLLVTINCIKH